MKPHINIGIIGGCCAASTLTQRNTALALIAILSKDHPDKEIEITWLEPDKHEELLERLFLDEKKKEYTLERFPNIFEGSTLQMVPYLRNEPIKSDFDFIKPRRHSGFDLKSSKIRSKHRPRARPT